MSGRRTTIGAVLAVVAVLCGGPALLAQEGAETKHWPLQKISFPVDTERLASLNPKPVKLRFYAAAPGGKFELVSERRVDDLEDIVDQASRGNRKGFNYTSRGDGTEEFALQYVFPNNDVSPRSDKLNAQYRIVFDTRPPSVRLAASAATSVDWVVEDENLVADSIRLEVRYPEQARWTPVGVRSFGSRDRYTWTNIPPGKVLEVRVVCKDRAGHEGVSQVVRLPSGNGAGGRPSPVPELGSGDPLTKTPSSSGSGFGGPDDLHSRPQIEYVNTNKLTVRSKFTRITRSGIDAAQLWVNDGKSGWKEDSKKTALSITTVTKDPQVEMPYTAPKDGLYGFLIQPVNGAGGKPDDPRENDPAQWLVEVDMLPPQVEVRAVRVAPGGLSGPRVEVEWVATDKNLMPEPVTIEYQEVDGKSQDWKPIAVKIPNTGRYIWEVEDKLLWKFRVRVTAVDKASNSTRTEYKDIVLVDLEKPSGVIEKVQGSGPPMRQSNRPTEEPMEPRSQTIPPTQLPVPAPMTKFEPPPVPMTKLPDAPPALAPLPSTPTPTLPPTPAPPVVVQPLPTPVPTPTPTPTPVPSLPMDTPPVVPTPMVPMAPGGFLPVPALPNPK